jgi:hypothetical protein
MNPPANKKRDQFRLTATGCRLYHLWRKSTRGELTPDDFVRNILCRDVGDHGSCLSCEEFKPLAGHSFCQQCAAGSFLQT